MVLANKNDLISPINFWSPLLSRLNFICIAIHCTLFKNPIDPEKDKKMNFLWRVFFENFKLINVQVRNKLLDPKKVNSSQEKNLKKHKEFFMFWFNKLLPKMGRDTELEKVLKFLQSNFREIYGANHVFWLLNLSKPTTFEESLIHTSNLDQRFSEPLSVPNRRQSSEGAFHWGPAEKPRFSSPDKKAKQEESNDEELRKVKSIDSSMLVSKSIFNKFQTPKKSGLKMVEEEQPISTDSEIEEFQKSVTKFKKKQPTVQGKQVFGDALGFNKNETFDRLSKYFFGFFMWFLGDLVEVRNEE